MDYADQGDLFTKLQASEKLLSEMEVVNIFIQVCLAVKFAHDLKVMHRDIKSQNIFLKKSGIVMLGDFGISKVLSTTTAAARTKIGSP